MMAESIPAMETPDQLNPDFKADIESAEEKIMEWYQKEGEEEEPYKEHFDDEAAKHPTPIETLQVHDYIRIIELQYPMSKTLKLYYENRHYLNPQLVTNVFLKVGNPHNQQFIRIWDQTAFEYLSGAIDQYMTSTLKEFTLFGDNITRFIECQTEKISQLQDNNKTLQDAVNTAQIELNRVTSELSKTTDKLNDLVDKLESMGLNKRHADLLAPLHAPLPSSSGSVTEIVVYLNRYKFAFERKNNETKFFSRSNGHLNPDLKAAIQNLKNLTGRNWSELTLLNRREVAPLCKFNLKGEINTTSVEWEKLIENHTRHIEL